MSAISPTVVGGLIFCISATPHPGSLFPLFHEVDPHTSPHPTVITFLSPNGWVPIIFL